ncbi:hypothetical protein OSTOST_24883, partial [Ostertagia ostertagi]
MAICIHPWAGETAILPRLLDDVFSEIDDVFNELAQIEPPIHSVARRKGRKALAGSLGKVTDDGSKLAISLDVSKFKPDELKVNIDGRTLTIEGKQEITEGHSFADGLFQKMLTSSRSDPPYLRTVSWPSRCPSRNQPSPPEPSQSKRLSISSKQGLIIGSSILFELFAVVFRTTHVHYDLAGTVILCICMY